MADKEKDINYKKRVARELKQSLKSKISRIEYLSYLRDEMKDNRKRMLQSILYFIILVCLFFLLTQLKVDAEIKTPYFDIEDKVIIIQIIPFLSSIALYRYIAYSNKYDDQLSTHRFLTSVLFKVKKSSFLHKQLEPFTIVESFELLLKRRPSTPMDYLTYVLVIPIILVVALGPIGFLLYTIFEVNRNYQPTNTFMWILFTTSVVCVFIVILLNMLSTIETLKKVID